MLLLEVNVAAFSADHASIKPLVSVFSSGMDAGLSFIEPRSELRSEKL